MDSMIFPETDLNDYFTITETQYKHYNTTYINANYYEHTYVDAMVFPGTYTQSETNALLANNISTTGDVSISGKLGIGTASPYDSLHVLGATRIEPASHVVLVVGISTSTIYGSNSYAINAFGRSADFHSRFNLYNSRTGYNCNVIADGNFTVRNTFYNNSDDRLKTHKQIIENACDTLNKLRPHIYTHKLTIDNGDPTTWYKESGLIAQYIYYDAPELRHLVNRGDPKLDEEAISYHYLKSQPQ